MAVPDYIDFQGTIIPRKGTALQWSTKNPILREAEMGLEVGDAQPKLKIGDGTTAWNDLPYAGLEGPQGTAGPSGPKGDTGDVTPAATDAKNRAEAAATRSEQAATLSDQAKTQSQGYMNASQNAAVAASGSANDAANYASTSANKAQEASDSADRAAASATTASAAKDTVTSALAQVQDGKRDTYVGNKNYVPGSSKTLTLSNVPLKAATLSIYFGGVFQNSDAYSLSGKVVTFTEVIPAEVMLIEALYQVPGTAYSADVIAAGNQAQAGADLVNNALNQVQAGKKQTFRAGIEYTPDVTTTLVLDNVPLRDNSIQIYFGPAYQQKSQFSLSGKNINFTSPIPSGAGDVEVYYQIPGTAYNQATVDAANAAAASATAAANSAASVALGTVQDYAALRTYNGNATTVLVRANGIFGNFVKDTTDTTTADNSATTIVGVGGVRWKRLFYGNEIFLDWFYSGTGTYDTALNSALAFATNSQNYPIRLPRQMSIAGPINLPASAVLRGSHGGANATSTYGTIITHVPTSSGQNVFNTLGTALSTVEIENVYIIGSTNGFTSNCAINFNSVLGGTLKKIGIGQYFTEACIIVTSAQDIRLQDINLANANTTNATPAGLLFKAGGVGSISTSVKVDGVYVHGVSGATGGITDGIVTQGDAVIQSEFRLPVVESVSRYAINIHKGNQIDFYSTYTENVPNIDAVSPIIRIAKDTPSAVRVTSVNFYGGGIRGPNAGASKTFAFELGVVGNLLVDGIVFGGINDKFMTSDVSSTNMIEIRDCSCSGATSFGTIGSPEGLIFAPSNKFAPSAIPAITRQSGPTANRPNFYLAKGQQHYNQTVSKPTWYDGASWRDATGTVV